MKPPVCLKKSKKRANPVSLGGVSSIYMLFRLAKSDGVEQSHKCPNPNDATFLIIAGLLFTNLHQ